jgi:hypothetical protein
VKFSLPRLIQALSGPSYGAAYPGVYGIYRLGQPSGFFPVGIIKQIALNLVFRNKAIEYDTGFFELETLAI